MISDEDVKLLFWNHYRMYGSRIEPNETLPTQLFRGKAGHTWDNQHPGSCARHKAVFETLNIIPEYCFSCFKITTQPRNVIELFKLMMIFEKLRLPNDNTRKCTVETREQVSGSYKGLIYCRSIKEAKETRDIVQKLVAEQVSKKVQTRLGRGCSEYALSYPEYPKVKNGKAAMAYREEWRADEERAEKTLVYHTQHSSNDTHNTPSYTLEDTKVMLGWLRYAATIGDLNYMKISNQVLQPFPNIKRPSTFQPSED